MVKRIIIEGADQQGKTTLVNALSKRLGWNIIKFDKPDGNFDFFHDYKFKIKTISDRNYLSELVYSKINGFSHRVTKLKELENHFNDNYTILIMLDRGADYVFDNSRHEDYSEEQIARAITIYREEFKKLKIKKYIINPNCFGCDNTVEMIIKMILT